MREINKKDNYQNLLDAIPGGIAVYRSLSVEQTELVYFNDELCAITGYSTEEIRSLEVNQICMAIPEDIPLIIKSMREQLSIGNYMRSQRRVLCKGGCIKWVSVQAHRLHDEEGDDSLYCIFTDITEQKKTEGALRIENKKLEVALTNSKLYLWEYDIVGKRCTQQQNERNDFTIDGIIENAPEAVIERGVIHPTSINEYRELHNQIIQGAKSAKADICFLDEEGHALWKRCTYTTIFVDGQPVSAIGCAVDISSIKEMERKFKEEVAYIEAVQSENLLLKARANITQNMVESYNGKDNLSVASMGVQYTVWAEELAKVGFTSDDQEKIRTYLNRDRVLKAFAKGENTYSVEYRRKTHDGSLIWVNTTVKSYKNPEAEDIMSFMYTYDITENKIKDGIINAVTSLEYDYIAYINLKNETFKLYHGGENYQQMLPAKSTNYTQSVYEVNHAVVVPEDVERAICDMLPDGIRENLKKQRVFSTVYSIYGENETIR